jgi:RimJ/RimL family protein N-acetyltransferase
MMGFPLASPRLRILPLAHVDVPAFVAYRRQEAVARWQTWDTGYTEAQALALLAHQAGWEVPPPGEWMQLALRCATTEHLVGDIALHLLDDQPDTWELGFTIAPPWQGRGFATEGAARVIHHVFAERGAHRVVAFCDARNAASQRVLRRLGFRQESHQVEADFFKGEWTTLDGFAILAREAPPRLSGTAE